MMDKWDMYWPPWDMPKAIGGLDDDERVYLSWLDAISTDRLGRLETTTWGDG